MTGSLPFYADSVFNALSDLSAMTSQLPENAFSKSTPTRGCFLPNTRLPNGNQLPQVVGAMAFTLQFSNEDHLQGVMILILQSLLKIMAFLTQEDAAGFKVVSHLTPR